MQAPTGNRILVAALVGATLLDTWPAWSAEGFRAPAMQVARGRGGPGAAALPDFNGEYTGEAPAPEEPLSLWYRRPARRWTEALAIGSGRLGAMVFGGINRERLQLNEDTLWGGGPYDQNNPEALAALPEARRLIFEGKYRDADQLVNQ